MGLWPSLPDILFRLAAFGAAAAPYENLRWRDEVRDLRERSGDDVDTANERRRRLR